ANVLEANAVRYSAIVENFVNDSKTGLSYGGDPITVGYKWMDLTIYVGRMMSSGDLTINETRGNQIAAGKDRFSIEVDTVNGVEWDRWDWNGNPFIRRNDILTVKDGKDHTDLVGMEVKVLAGDKADEVYGVYATGTSKVVETTMDQIDVLSNNDMKIDGETYDTNGAKVYADLDRSTTIGVVFTAEGEKVADDVKIIDWDDNGDYETILVNTVAMAEVTHVGSSSISVGDYGARAYDHPLGNTRTLDFDENTIYEDIALGDYAVIRQNLYNGDFIVEQAEEVTGTINGLVYNERRIRIDGEWYTLANNAKGAADDDSDLYTIEASRSVFTNGDQVALYIVGDIVYMAQATTGNDANRQVLMVYDSYMYGNSWNRTAQVKVILANGDKETVDLADVDGNSKFTAGAGDTINEVNVGRMYSYEVNNDGEYELTTLIAGNQATLAGYDEVVASDGIVNERYVGTPDEYAIADDAVVFALIGGDDAEVYTGEQIKDAVDTGDNAFGGYYSVDGARQQALIQSEGGFTYARMFNVELDEDLNGIVNYAYLLDDAVSSETEKDIMEYHYWDGADIADKNESTSSVKTYLRSGMIITYANDGEDIKDVRRVTMSGDELRYAAITNAKGDNIAIRYMNGNVPVSDVLEADGDTKVIYVDTSKTGDAKAVEDTGFAKTAANVNGGGKYINAAYIVGDDGKLDFILIDVSGRLRNIPDNILTIVDDDDAARVTGAWAKDNSDPKTRTYDGTDGSTLRWTFEGEGYAAPTKIKLTATVTDENGEEVDGLTGDLITGIELNDANNFIKRGGIVFPVLNAGEYTITVTANDGESVKTVLTDTYTVEEAEITSYSGFDPGIAAAPEADTTLMRIEDAIRASMKAPQNTEIIAVDVTAVTANKTPIEDDQDLEANDKVTIKYTLEASDNYVFDVDGVNMNGEGKELHGVKPDREVQAGGKTATITYVFTIGGLGA
ncbi:MAG: hypothetical protein KH295_12150, partial [Clostridiaceae bacterium]|nr:hypothetical protein [Clostridiaceae bacterium]